MSTKETQTEVSAFKITDKKPSLKEILNSALVAEALVVTTEFNDVAGIVLKDPTNPGRRIVYDREVGFVRTPGYSIDKALQNHSFVRNAFKFPKDIISISKEYGMSSAVMYAGFAVQSTIKGGLDKLDSIFYN